jgi:hypothetical protein
MARGDEGLVDDEKEEDEELPEYLRKEREDDPANLSKEMMAMAREFLKETKDSNKGGLLSIRDALTQLGPYKTPSKEEIKAQAELYRIDGDHRSVILITNTLLARTIIQPEDAVDMAFGVVQAINKKFEQRRKELREILDKEGNSSHHPIPMPPIPLSGGL